ncbi:MAG TPA: hypothetical protein VGB73_18355 [Pyrinomonadaceae bacterium]|jgi:hypothetical protein
MLKKLAGVAAFLVGLAVAIAVTKFYAPSPSPPPPQPPQPPVVADVPPPTPPAPVQMEEPPFSYKAQLVTLDFASAKTHTRLALEASPTGSAPERIWVWTYFFVPGEQKIWAGEPVEIKRPFAGGSRASIVASADCNWCGDARAPEAGYYARIHVSSESAQAARPASEEINYSIKTAVPVVVEGKRQRN